MRRSILVLFTAILSIGAAPNQPAIPLKATYLRCENLANPLGIDEKSPRLSWLLESDQRGQKQSAYRILVASTEATLKADKGDLWDTGKVASDQISQIAYAGKPLVSHERCYWKVQVWDKDDKPVPWSEAAMWSVGLLNPAEWKAQWIGYDKPRKSIQFPDAPLEPAKWIWFAKDQPQLAPQGMRVFMTSFTVPDDAKIEKAELLVAADDRYWFIINGQQIAVSPEKGSGFESVTPVDVTAHVKPGKNFIRAQVENYAFGPAGLIAKLTISLGEGKTATVVTDDSWHATDNAGANWHNRDIAEDAWPKVQVLGEYGMQPWGKLKLAGLRLPPPALLRSNFRAEKPLKRATLYASALGLYDLSINGKHVEEDRYGPGWTDYARRVYYRAYDVTKLLKDGDNALGAVLADGWFCGYVGYGKMRDHYGKNARFAAQIHLDYEDGSATDFATGPDWRAGTGAIREADFLMGETYEANKAIEDWDQPYFDDSKWDKVDVGAEVKPLVQHHPGPPVIEINEFKPVNVTEPKPGVFVLDMGQNFAGFARLKVKGDSGQKITLRFAERLNPDGTIYTANLRSARSTDTYICRGGGDAETWQPRFTFHGFQYIEATGLKEKPADDVITGVAISSDTPLVGTFTCSDPLLTRLHQNIYWTQRANFIDIPTDCPQRDERLGWTGDAQVYCRTATLNCDVESFFTKWLVDLEDGQRADGQFPMVAPVKVAGDDGGPAWADAGVICPWAIYEVYNDRRILERHYDSMVKFVEFCRKRCTPELLPPKQYHCFGDWLSINADTPKDVIFLAYFAKSARIVARAAEVLGKAEDAKKYNDLFEKIKVSFNQHFVDPEGKIHGDTQACYALAIASDLLPPERQKQAAARLVADIQKRQWHLSTGFVGTRDLMAALSKIGRSDVAYRLLHQDTFPSWNFSIKQGATSIWERWDGWTPTRGFQDPGMNSFAHYSFGAVYQWMVENLAGIRAASPGYNQIEIAPQPDAKLKYARTTYRSPRGKIATSWTLEGEKFTLDVTIPPGATANVYLPSSGGKITESGKDADAAPGVTVMRTADGRALIAIGSGTYHFASTVRLASN